MYITAGIRIKECNNADKATFTKDVIFTTKRIKM
jgi:hypothetical protein